MGERNKRSARIIHAGAYETFHLSDFIYGLMPRSISQDFDCREAKPRSHGASPQTQKRGTAAVAQSPFLTPGSWPRESLIHSSFSPKSVRPAPPT